MLWAVPLHCKRKRHGKLCCITLVLVMYDLHAHRNPFFTAGWKLSARLRHTAASWLWHPCMSVAHMCHVTHSMLIVPIACATT